VPLVSTRTLQRLVKDSADGDLALSTAVVDDPSGYGRVIRDERGEVERIVEDKDATDDERRVNEVSTGLMAFAAGLAASSRSSTTTPQASTT
jgi:bifunctional UDP-N-acetylglucosamine pyrophosphorylase/glucosamine-1-phosphate N-acetyltransferase